MLSNNLNLGNENLYHQMEDFKTDGKLFENVETFSYVGGNKIMTYFLECYTDNFQNKCAVSSSLCLWNLEINEEHNWQTPGFYKACKNTYYTLSGTSLSQMKSFGDVHKFNPTRLWSKNESGNWLATH